MNKLIRTITAGALALGLTLGCAGCGVMPHPEEPGTIPQKLPTDPTPTEPFTPVTSNGAPVSPHLLELDNLVAAPEYPEMPQCPRQEDYPEGSQQFYQDQDNWYHQRRQYLTASPDNAHDLDGFLQKALTQFLDVEGNRVCAPLNVYFALAMLAETTGGSSRQQILDALGHDSIDTLRAQANQLWKAHYINDGETTSLMANSVWLDREYIFNDGTLASLAEHHYASVFTGDLGTEEMDRQLAAWLDSQTGNLLSEYTKNIQLDPLSVFCLASTAYFCADWNSSFSEDSTYPEVFHGAAGDVTTDFMHGTTMSQRYCTGGGFTAVQLGLSGNHSMWLILPDEGSSPEEVLASGEYYRLISDPDSWKKQQLATVHLSMPRFDISSDQDLIPGLKAMGIQDVFQAEVADYSPMCPDPLVLGKASHAARVAADEEGVVAAAYTLMIAYATGAPVEEEIEFTVNRPFLFTITGSDHLPLFAGVVEMP